jgi:transcriptional regulator with XRE-family HTH domain
MDVLMFAENVKHLRENDALKQSEIAVNIGFFVQKWNNYERGISFPKLEDLEKISKHFGITETDLLHAEIAESDLIVLYNRFIESQEQPFKIGNTPRSKSFKSYFNTAFSAIPPAQSEAFVTKIVTNTVTNPVKKGSIPASYNNKNTDNESSILSEPSPSYGSGAKKSQEARIAALEALFQQIKELFTQFNP